MTQLTLAKVADLTGKDIRECPVLDASNQDITQFDDLSPCVELKRVNLSKNQITSLEGLQYNKGITFLNVFDNQLESIWHVRKLVKLKVLNASHNKLITADGLRGLVALNALILNHNELKVLPSLGSHPELNTLVVSHNQIESINGVQRLIGLTKISATHNLIRVLPDLSQCHELIELRLSDNKLSGLPDSLQSNIKLKILELGNNIIAAYSDIAVLSKLPGLKTLTLKGNSITKLPDYKEKIAELIPSLEVLDGERFRGRKFIRNQVIKARKMTTKPSEQQGVEPTGKRVRVPSDEEEEPKPFVKKVKTEGQSGVVAAKKKIIQEENVEDKKELKIKKTKNAEKEITETGRQEEVDESKTSKKKTKKKDVSKDEVKESEESVPVVKEEAFNKYAVKENARKKKQAPVEIDRGVSGVVSVERKKPAVVGQLDVESLLSTMEPAAVPSWD